MQLYLIHGQLSIIVKQHKKFKMNTIKIKGLIIAIITFGLISSFSMADPIIGKWSAPDMENSIIQVYKDKDGFIYGKIIDCDKKEWIGKIVLRKVTYDRKNNQWKGEVYSLLRNTSIDVTLNLESRKKLRLVGKKLFFTKTFYWSKKEK